MPLNPEGRPCIKEFPAIKKHFLQRNAQRHSLVEEIVPREPHSIWTIFELFKSVFELAILNDLGF